MTSFEYSNEAGKNYLSIGKVKEEDYITKMLLHNHIPGLVGALLKSRNAESRLVYQTNGLISFSQFLEIKKLTLEEMESFLRGLIKIYHSMEEYLLPFDLLIVDPKYIFKGYGKEEEILFICANENVKSYYLTNLFEDIMDKIDYSDERVVTMVYSLYQACKNFESFQKGQGHSGLLPMICKKAEEILSQKRNDLDSKVREWMEEENKLAGSNERGIEEMYQEPPLFDQSLIKQNREKEWKEDGEFRLRDVRKNLEHRQGSEIKKTNKEGRNKEKVKKVFQKVWTYLNADLGSGKEGIDRPILVKEEQSHYKLRDVKVVTLEESGTKSKPTTLLTNGMVQGGIYCLKPIERGEESIFLTSYPFFIGKAKKDIQMSIEDSTVSRYHARIDRDKDCFWLTDLSSTNGTFLNGTRLTPYERMELKEGDYIVISRKRYELQLLREV